MGNSTIRDRVTRYGFTYGPAVVSRLSHIPDRGRVLEVFTRHARVQIYVSEAGRKITIHPQPPYKDFELMAGMKDA